MSASERKIYRIEMEQARRRATGEALAGQRHDELLQAINMLADRLADHQTPNGSGDLRGFVPAAEAERLKHEVGQMAEAIEHTKREIAALRYANRSNDPIRSVTDELDAVVEGTESATHTILEAAEQIETLVGDIGQGVRQKKKLEAIEQVQDQVVNILQACNFQDITGQRISKVVGTMHFIEERLMTLRDVWGGEDALAEHVVEPEIEEDDPKALLNGPALEGELDTASQDDIDALFD